MPRDYIFGVDSDTREVEESLEKIGQGLDSLRGRALPASQALNRMGELAERGIGRARSEIAKLNQALDATGRGFVIRGVAYQYRLIGDEANRAAQAVDRLRGRQLVDPSGAHVASRQLRSLNDLRQALAEFERQQVRLSAADYLAGQRRELGSIAGGYGRATVEAERLTDEQAKSLDLANRIEDATNAYFRNLQNAQRYSLQAVGIGGEEGEVNERYARTLERRAEAARAAALEEARSVDQTRQLDAATVAAIRRVEELSGETILLERVQERAARSSERVGRATRRSARDVEQAAQAYKVLDRSGPLGDLRRELREAATPAGELADAARRAGGAFGTLRDRVRAVRAEQMGAAFAERDREASVRRTAAVVRGEITILAAARAEERRRIADRVRLNQLIERTGDALEAQLNRQDRQVQRLRNLLNFQDVADLDTDAYRRAVADVDRLNAAHHRGVAGAEAFNRELQDNARAAANYAQGIRRYRLQAQPIIEQREREAAALRELDRAYRRGTAALRQHSELRERAAVLAEGNRQERRLAAELRRQAAEHLRTARAMARQLAASDGLTAAHRRLLASVRRLNRSGGGGGLFGGGAGGRGGGGFYDGLRNITRRIVPFLTLLYATRSALFATERAFRFVARGARFFGRAVQQAAEFGNTLYIQSRNLRFSVQELLLIRQVFEGVGLSADQASNLIEEVFEKAGRALVGTRRTQLQARHLFRQIGIDLDELQRLSGDPVALFERTLAGLSHITNPAERAQVAAQLLGDQSRDLVGVLVEMAVANDRAADRQERQGTVTERQAYAMRILNEEIKGFFQFGRQVGVVFSTYFSPSIKAAINSFYELTGGVQGFGDTVQRVVGPTIRLFGRLVTVFEFASRQYRETFLATLFRSLPFLGLLETRALKIAESFDPEGALLIRSAFEGLTRDVAQFGTGLARTEPILRTMGEEIVKIGLGLENLEPPKALDTTGIQLAQNDIAYRKGIERAKRYIDSLDQQNERTVRATVNSIVYRDAELAAATARDRATQSIQDRQTALRRQIVDEIRNIRQLEAQNAQIDKNVEAMERLRGELHQLGREREAAIERAGRAGRINALAQSFNDALRGIEEVGRRGADQLRDMDQASRELDFEQRIQGLPTFLQQLYGTANREIEQYRTHLREVYGLLLLGRDALQKLRSAGELEVDGLPLDALEYTLQRRLEAIEELYGRAEVSVNERTRKVVEGIRPLRIALGDLANDAGRAFADLVLDIENGLDHLGGVIERFVNNYLELLFNKFIYLRFPGLFDFLSADNVSTGPGVVTGGPGTAGAPGAGAGGAGGGLTVNNTLTFSGAIPDEQQARRVAQILFEPMVDATTAAVRGGMTRPGVTRTVIKYSGRAA